MQIKVEEAILQREVHEKMEAEAAKPRHLARTLSYVQRAVDATRSNDQEVRALRCRGVELQKSPCGGPTCRFVNTAAHILGPNPGGITPIK